MSAAMEKALSDLLRKLGTPAPPEFPDAEEPVSVLVMSMLLWESSTAKALAAYGKLREAMVDFNELRVCMPQELIDCLGVRYPLASERCQRLRAALNDVFRREHDVKLEHLRGGGKRDVKKYVESLDGMTPYAAARVQLICFESHAIPVDEQLRAKLIAAGVIEDSHNVPDVVNILSRSVKVGDGLAAHYAFQHWVDTGKPAIGKGGGKASARAAGSRRSSSPAGTPKRRASSSSKVS